MAVVTEVCCGSKIFHSVVIALLCRFYSRASLAIAIVVSVSTIRGAGRCAAKDAGKKPFKMPDSSRCDIRIWFYLRVP